MSMSQSSNVTTLAGFVFLGQPFSIACSFSYRKISDRFFFAVDNDRQLVLSGIKFSGSNEPETLFALNPDDFIW